jgi:hypothetical protein
VDAGYAQGETGQEEKFGLSGNRKKGQLSAISHQLSAEARAKARARAKAKATAKQLIDRGVEWG